MDHSKSMKWNLSENGMKADSSTNTSKSLLNAESIFSVHDLIYSIPGYSNDDSLVVYDVEKGCEYGVLIGSEVVYATEWSTNRNRVIVADLKNGRLEVYENKVLVSFSGTQEIIDLNTNGRRWEGNVKDRKPYGYGVIYDEEGRKVFEGFMINESKTCYGIEYCIDIERMKYEGCYYNNNRFGNGILYDRNGVVDYEGIWKNNQPYSSSFDGRTIDNHTESIVIPIKSFNETELFILPPFIQSLKQIVIRDACLGMIRSFELEGLIELKSVEIGQYCFRISDSERSDGICRIVNCPKLKSIQTGDWLFHDYHSFELNNLFSLQSIDIGKYCFCNAPSFALTGLID